MADHIVAPTRPLEPQPKAIIVGASSGIGAALARELARRGYVVAALARREAELQQLLEQSSQELGRRQILPFTHDVTSFDTVPQVFQEATHALGGLDLIIYAAGVQPQVSPTEYNFQKDYAMASVNLLGAMAWLDLAADRFQRAEAGHIVGISSITGDRGRRAFPGYHASKGGLSIYLESLRNRLWPQGVRVTTIKPGFVDTRLLENAPKTMWVISPEEAARRILDAVQKKKQTVYIPARWRLVSLIIRHIPSIIFRRLNL